MDSYETRTEACPKLVRNGALGQLPSWLAAGLLHLAGAACGRSVLDAGNGEGHLARLFAKHGANVVGVDIAPRLIRAARGRPNYSHAITVLEPDLTRGLPTYRGHLDLVAANSVLDGAADLIGFLRTVRQSLAPGGRFHLPLDNSYSAVPRGKVEAYVASGSVGRVFGRERVGFEAPYDHRTLQDRLAAFRKGGFLTRSLRDAGKEPDVPGSPATLVPSLLILELVQSYSAPGKRRRNQKRRRHHNQNERDR